MLRLSSNAKINLFLEILGRRADGFHTLRTLMLPIALGDTLTFKAMDAPRIELECSDPSLPTDGTNLVRRAAELLQKNHAPSRGARIRIEKRIPIGAGLGGGSSNGSTALRGLNELWQLGLGAPALEKLAAEFGSDTAFFIRNQAALCEGRGEIITPVPFPSPLTIFLMNPGFGSATAWAYKNLNLSANHASPVHETITSFLQALQTSPSQISNFKFQIPLVNDLEVPVFRKFPVLSLAKKFLASQPGVTGAMMCGSGSTMMALLGDGADAGPLCEAVTKQFGSSIWIWTGKTL